MSASSCSRVMNGVICNTGRCSISSSGIAMSSYLMLRMSYSTWSVSGVLLSIAVPSLHITTHPVRSFLTNSSSLSVSGRAMGVSLTVLSPMVQHAPLVVIYPSIRWLIAPRLLMNGIGRPVEMNIFMPFSLARVRAFTVDCGMACVVKLTSVPSISKNSAFIMTL